MTNPELKFPPGWTAAQTEKVNWYFNMKKQIIDLEMQVQLMGSQDPDIRQFIEYQDPVLRASLRR